MVEPERGLTALHRAAWAHRELRFFSGERLGHQDFNVATSREVINELLLRFNSESYLDARCQGLGGWTALHFAVDAQNAVAVQALVNFHANVDMADNCNKTPLSLAREVQAASPSMELENIIKLLEEAVPNVSSSKND